jgi:hypothetical protein
MEIEDWRCPRWRLCLKTGNSRSHAGRAQKLASIDHVRYTPPPSIIDYS